MAKQRLAKLDNAGTLSQETQALRRQLGEANQRIDALSEELKQARSRRAFKLGRPRSGKKRGGFTRVTWGDSHGMRVDRAAFAAFVEDLTVICPSEVICMGDALDCDGFLSKYPPVGYRSLSKYSFAEDVEAANEQWDAVCKAAPTARHDAIEGNHEARVCSRIRELTDNDRDERFFRDRFDPVSVMALDKRGVAYHSRLEQHDGLQKRGTIKRGKCLFVHGDSHAKRAAEVHLMGMASNCVFAHTHRMEQFVTSTEATGVIGAWNPGCLCELHPMYQHSKPSNWSHGYGLQFVANDGDFLHLNVPIIRGRSLLGPMLTAMKA